MPDSSGTASFLGGFLDSLGDGVIEAKQREHKREVDMLEGRKNLIKSLVGLPDVQNDPAAMGQAYLMYDEALRGDVWKSKGGGGGGGGGKKQGKNGGHSPLSIMAHLAPLLHPAGLEAMKKKEMRPADLGVVDQPATQSVIQDPITGGMLPGAPRGEQGRGILGALKTPEQRAEAQRAIDASQHRADQSLGQEDIDRTIGLMKVRLSRGEISQGDFQRAVAELQSGVKLPNASAAFKNKPTSVEIADSDAPGGKRWIPAQFAYDDNGNTVYYKLAAAGQTPQEIPIEQILQLGPPPRDYNRNSPEWNDDNSYALRELKRQHPDWPEDVLVSTAQAYADARWDAKKKLEQQQGQTRLGQTQQRVGVMGERTGVGGAPAGAGMPPLPTAPITAPGAGGAPTGGASRAPNVGATPTARTGAPAAGAAGAPGAVKGAASGRPKVISISGRAPDTRQQGGAPSVLVQQMLDTNPLVRKAYAWLLNGGKDELKGDDSVGINKGLGMLSNATGLNMTQLANEAQARQQTQQQLKQATGRLEAVGEINQQLDGLGKLVVNMRRKVGNDIPRLRQIKNYLATNYTKDPEVNNLRTAINEFNRPYARLTSGGAQSMGHIPVSASEVVDGLLDESKSVEQAAGFIDTVKQGAQIDQDAYKRLIKVGQQELSKPWGQFDSTNIVPDLTGGAAGGDPDMIWVQIPGQQPGKIHKSQLKNFMQRYPNGKQVQQPAA